jgi:hypothetical protein
MSTQREFENADPLNILLWSDDPDFDSYIENLSNRLCATSNQLDELKQITITKHLKIMVLNLWCIYLKDKQKYLGVSRDITFFSALSRKYNPNKYSFKSVVVMDALKECEFITLKIGQYRQELKRRTRIRATEKLINEIVKEFKIQPTAIQIARQTECIVMRNKQKKDVDFKENKRIKEMRNGLIEYNNLIRRTHIDIPTFPPIAGVKLASGLSFRINFENDADKFTKRIFSNKSWTDGGRFYGGWWQQVPNRKVGWRSNIRINRKPTIEIDYSGLHIVFLYAKKKIDYWSEINKDPYDLSEYGYSMDKKLRRLLKVVLLTSINCEKGINKDLSVAKKSVQYEINIKNAEEFKWVKKDNLDIEQLIFDFADYHKPIRQYFYSGKGISLQHIDGLVAEKVINHFTKLNIPVLCIHDSFIIQEEYAVGDGDESLEFMMWCFFEQVVKSEMKTYAYGQLKSDPPLPARDIVNNQAKITKAYWLRVDRHMEREFVINWYSTDKL